jgi:hypothetical protein
MPERKIRRKPRLHHSHVPLSPADLAHLRELARCPDCPADVRVSSAGMVDIWHDAGCPTKAALDRGHRPAVGFYGGLNLTDPHQR